MWYRDAEHFKSENGYAVNNEWYPRVTRIIQVKSKPALEYFFREIDSYSSVEEIKNKSAEEGSRLHDVVERILLGEDFEAPPELQTVATAFQKFNLARKIEVQPEFVERRIWSARGRYAGTVDSLASIDGKFGVLDIKTSTAFYPDYNIQTAAYMAALSEPEIKKALALPHEIETRWILRIDQHRPCRRCGASLRLKGGRHKVRIRNARTTGGALCFNEGHDWAETEAIIEMREFPNVESDFKAFEAAKVLWEWEYDRWLKEINYI